MPRTGLPAEGATGSDEGQDVAKAVNATRWNRPRRRFSTGGVLRPDWNTAPTTTQNKIRIRLIATASLPPRCHCGRWSIVPSHHVRGSYIVLCANIIRNSGWSTVTYVRHWLRSHLPNLPMLHNAPFDRLSVAQSTNEGAILNGAARLLVTDGGMV